MLKKDLVLQMATLLKMDVAAVTAAYDDKEKEIDVTLKPEGLKIFTDVELTSREETLKSLHEKAGMEITIKNLKAENAIEFEGKDPKKFVEALKAKTLADAGVKESDKIKELNTTIEGLRTNLSTATQEKELLSKQTKESQTDSDILSWTIDKKPDHLTNKEWLTLIKSNNEITEQEGQMFVKRDGKLVSNPADLKPIPAKDALVSYIDERKWGKVAQTEEEKLKGRGAGDSNTSFQGIGNMKQFNEHLKEQGINANGDKAKQILNDVTAANPNFDFAPAA